MKYLIDLPDVIKDSAGVEYEPTGEYRVPNNGEFMWAAHTTRVEEQRGYHGNAYIILRRKLTPIEKVRAAYQKVTDRYAGTELEALGEAITALEAQCSSS